MCIRDRYKGRISYLLGENKDAISYLEKAKEHKQMLASYYLGLAYDANGAVSYTHLQMMVRRQQQ